MQERRYSRALAIELHLSCTNTLKCWFTNVKILIYKCNEYRSSRLCSDITCHQGKKCRIESLTRCHDFYLQLCHQSITSLLCVCDKIFPDHYGSPLYLQPNWEFYYWKRCISYNKERKKTAKKSRVLSVHYKSWQCSHKFLDAMVAINDIYPLVSF